MTGAGKIEPMSDERTKELPDLRSFEERVFARFDAMDARFDDIETRLEKRFKSIDEGSTE